jgi:hypothetical protein
MELKDITPSAAAITAEALKYIEREGWEEEHAQPCWLALLYDAEGDFRTGGQGATACEAAAAAWLWTWHPMGDTAGYIVLHQSRPFFTVPEGWDGVVPEIEPGNRFELFPPGTWETGSPEWDRAWPGADDADQGPPASWVERRRKLLAPAPASP